MEKDALARLDADGLALAEHAPIDREEIVGEFIALLETLAERLGYGFVRRLF